MCLKVFEFQSSHSLTVLSVIDHIIYDLLLYSNPESIKAVIGHLIVEASKGRVKVPVLHIVWIEGYFEVLKNGSELIG